MIVTDSLMGRLIGRILLIPVIASISYEILKIGEKFSKYKIIRILNVPGLWIQKITTKEPTKYHIDIAIRALKEVI